MTLRFGILVFPDMRQMGLTSVYEVFSSVADAEVVLVSKDDGPVTASGGFVVQPGATLTTCPPLDVLCILGGPGVNELLEDEDILGFVRARAHRVRFVVAVSCGSLLLGAAGILRGRRATTHWLSFDLLERFGAIPVDQTVVQDGSLLTTNGQASGVDMALRVVTELSGRKEAETIQLMMDHPPASLFWTGVIGASPDVLLDAQSRLSDERRREEEVVNRIAPLEAAFDWR